jgi:hypothetical protein
MGRRKRNGSDEWPLERQPGEDWSAWMDRAGRNPVWLRLKAADLDHLPERQRYFLDRAEMIESGIEPPGFRLSPDWTCGQSERGLRWESRCVERLRPEAFADRAQASV